MIRGIPNDEALASLALHFGNVSPPMGLKTHPQEWGEHCPEPKMEIDYEA
jgi:hypothetical protein